MFDILLHKALCKVHNVDSRTMQSKTKDYYSAVVKTESKPEIKRTTVTVQAELATGEEHMKFYESEIRRYKK